MSERYATKEVKHYFNNPAQATSFMIGQLKILELRDCVRQALGDRFDIRDFHAWCWRTARYRPMCLRSW